MHSSLWKYNELISRQSRDPDAKTTSRTHPTYPTISADINSQRVSKLNLTANDTSAFHESVHDKFLSLNARAIRESHSSSFRRQRRGSIRSKTQRHRLYSILSVEKRTILY